MYSVDRSFWLHMATLNFSSDMAVCSKFGRDQHQQLIRQFYHASQTTTVAEFVERFNSLMNHLLSYSEAIHPLYFLTRFVEALREYIKAVVIIQQPVDLEAACSLTLLQEEVSEGLRKEKYRRIDSYQGRANPRQGVPLPLPAPPGLGGLHGSQAATAACCCCCRNHVDDTFPLQSILSSEQ